MLFVTLQPNRHLISLTSIVAWRRDVVVYIWQCVLHSHESRRYTDALIGHGMSEGPPEFRSKILCTDPGRLKFHVDPPSGRIRQGLSAGAEIYDLARSLGPEPGAR